MTLEAVTPIKYTIKALNQLALIDLKATLGAIDVVDCIELDI
jgi:hypothetical protein